MKIVPQSCRKPLAIISIAASIALIGLPAHAFERVAESVSFTIKCFGLISLTRPSTSRSAIRCSITASMSRPFTALAIPLL